MPTYYQDRLMSPKKLSRAKSLRLELSLLRHFHFPVKRPRGYSPLIRVGTISGIVVGIVLLPITIPAALVAKSAVDTYNDLPYYLEVPDVPMASFLYTSDGKRITSFFDQYRFHTPLRKVNPYMRAAILSAEDSRFYEHNGVDPKGIVRAFVSNNNSGETQGASTITQQYVRNLLLAKAKTEKERDAA